MKTGFKDALAQNKDTKYTTYDKRSSVFVNKGVNYGVGVNAPIGKETASNSGGVPYGKVNTMRVDETGK